VASGFRTPRRTDANSLSWSRRGTRSLAPEPIGLKSGKREALPKLRLMGVHETWQREGDVINLFGDRSDVTAWPVDDGVKRLSLSLFR
jgi:hypothetical protein